MIMMKTGCIPESRAVEVEVLAMPMTMTTVRVRRKHRAIRQQPGKGREHRIRIQK
jgi:translation initiation factor IF-1